VKKARREESARKTRDARATTEARRVVRVRRRLGDVRRCILGDVYAQDLYRRERTQTWQNTIKTQPPCVPFWSWSSSRSRAPKSSRRSRRRFSASSFFDPGSRARPAAPRRPRPSPTPGRTPPARLRVVAAVALCFEVVSLFRKTRNRLHRLPQLLLEVVLKVVAAAARRLTRRRAAPRAHPLGRDVLAAVFLGARAGDVPLLPAAQALVLARAVHRQVVRALADLARAAVNVDALLVARAVANEVARLAAREAHRKLEVGVGRLALARGVVVPAAVEAGLLAAHASVRAALHHAAVAQRVARAPAPEAHQLALPDAAVAAAPGESASSAASGSHSAAAATAPAAAAAAAAAATAAAVLLALEVPLLLTVLEPHRETVRVTCAAPGTMQRRRWCPTRRFRHLAPQAWTLSQKSRARKRFITRVRSEVTSRAHSSARATDGHAERHAGHR